MRIKPECSPRLHLTYPYKRAASDISYSRPSGSAPEASLSNRGPHAVLMFVREAGAPSPQGRCLQQLADRARTVEQCPQQLLLVGYCATEPGSVCSILNTFLFFKRSVSAGDVNLLWVSELLTVPEACSFRNS